MDAIVHLVHVTLVHGRVHFVGDSLLVFCVFLSQYWLFVLFNTNDSTPRPQIHTKFYNLLYAMWPNMWWREEKFGFDPNEHLVRDSCIILMGPCQSHSSKNRNNELCVTVSRLNRNIFGVDSIYTEFIHIVCVCVILIQRRYSCRPVCHALALHFGTRFGKPKM